MVDRTRIGMLGAICDIRAMHCAEAERERVQRHAAAEHARCEAEQASTAQTAMRADFLAYAGGGRVEPDRMMRMGAQVVAADLAANAAASAAHEAATSAKAALAALQLARARCDQSERVLQQQRRAHRHRREEAALATLADRIAYRSRPA